MRSWICLTVISFAFVAVRSQNDDDFEFAGPSYNFVCPEKNGLFADPEQCDLYYVCVDNQSEQVLCPDGMVFDDSKRNKEECKLPHNVDCGLRGYVQEPRKDIDPRCQRAYGFFDHPDETICDKYYQCDNGVAYESSCAPPLVFDSAIGGCAYREQLSADAKVCDSAAVEVIEGFSCPTKEELAKSGPGPAPEHGNYPHPTDCRAFFSCIRSSSPRKLGCPEGKVYDAVTSVCKDAEEVPECACWYSCGEDSRCPDSCNADCTCPSGNEA